MIAERVLAVALLAAALGAAWAENGATLTARVREGRPWLAWIETHERGRSTTPYFQLSVYDPTRRHLALIHVSGELRIEGRRTLERAYLEALKASRDPVSAARAVEDLAEARLRELSPEPIPEVSARLVAEIPPLQPEEEPAVETARELKARGRHPRFWMATILRAGRGLRAEGRGALDPLLFALELRRVRTEDLEPVRLPDDGQAPALLGRLLSTDDRAGDDRATAIEVLNGAGAPGLATRAAKMLRFKGVDVLTTGSAPPRARTLVYDRVGDYARAEAVRAALGCPSSRAVTRLDPSRAVDVSIELGDDCVGAFGGGGGREP